MNSRARKPATWAVPLLCSLGIAVQVWANPPAPQRAPVSSATNAPVFGLNVNGDNATTNTPAAVPGPRIVFAEPVHDFGKISAGEKVKITFVFTNAGDETLIINAVNPGCGCTAAGEWSRQIEPGNTGTIPILFTTTGFGGPVAKTVTVVCNDKSHPTTTLQIKGTVWKAIDVVPAYAVLNVVPEASGATAVISITNNTEQPLMLSEPEVNNRAFTAVLSTNEPGKSFKLSVSTSATNTGSIQGQITLRTSSTNMPVVTITAWANVQPVISVIPPTLNLPPAPLANRMSPIVTLINNTTNPLSFSEPMVSPEGIQLQFREIQAGKYFTATLVFPQGFEMPPGKSGEFVVKSSHPKYPTLRVPIVQAPRQPGTQQTPTLTQVGQQPLAVGPAPAARPSPIPARPPHVLPRSAGMVAPPPMPPQPTK